MNLHLKENLTGNLRGAIFFCQVCLDFLLKSLRNPKQIKVLHVLFSKDSSKTVQWCPVKCKCYDVGIHSDKRGLC